MPCEITPGSPPAGDVGTMPDKSPLPGLHVMRTESIRRIASNRMMRFVLYSSTVLGVLLLSINVSGFFVPLRAPDVNGYRDFAGVETVEFAAAASELDRVAGLTDDPTRLVTEATRIFHSGMAHIAKEDVAANGLAHYRMRVPLTENWILYTLSYLKPDTYRDYEFCNYERALERGTGRCGQQAMALISYLSEQGLDTGFVALEGHAIATARIDDSRWYLLDPDYGAVIPFSISDAERDPASVLPYYWSDAAMENGIHWAYAPENRLKLGGPYARYPRACRVEVAAYILKWALPLLLTLALPAFGFYRHATR
jgi:hypothetical protein